MNCSPSVTPTGQHDDTNPSMSAHPRAPFSPRAQHSERREQHPGSVQLLRLLGSTPTCALRTGRRRSLVQGCEGTKKRRKGRHQGFVFFHFSIAIGSSFVFKSASIWRSETFPRLLPCNSDCESCREQGFDQLRMSPRKRMWT